MKSCSKCGEQMKMVNELFTCDLTGMHQYIEMGKCHCDDASLSGRMVNLGERPHYDVEAKKSFIHLTYKERSISWRS